MILATEIGCFTRTIKYGTVHAMVWMYAVGGDSNGSASLMICVDTTTRNHSTSSPFPTAPAQREIPYKADFYAYVTCGKPTVCLLLLYAMHYGERFQVDTFTQVMDDRVEALLLIMHDCGGNSHSCLGDVRLSVRKN